MKVGLLYPCVAALVEKMAALFPGLTVIGPACDNLYSWDKKILNLAKAKDRVKEWSEVGLDIYFEEKPYSECDFSKFDLLIESVETFNYSADWKNHCTRVECPTIVFVCWYDGPQYLPTDYRRKIETLPILLGMPSTLGAWQSACPQARVAPVPVGDWWFEREWNGLQEEALFVLAGKDLWRPSDKSICGVDLFEKLCERFPGKIHHHDGANKFKTANEMSEMFRQYRVFLNLDGPGGRPLTTSFTEALAAGMPVVARNVPTLSHQNYIDGNGTYTEDFDDMCDFIDLCFKNIAFARQCSARSREIARQHFSAEAVRPYYYYLEKSA